MKNTAINTPTTGGLKRKLFGALALVALTGSYAHAATTIYEDSFNGSSTNDLAGTRVQVSPNGELWQGHGADENFKANGSFTGTSTSGRVYIDFTPEAGNIYNFSATLNLNVNTTNAFWAGIAIYGETVTPQGLATLGVQRDTGNVFTSRNAGAFATYNADLWNGGQPITANLEFVLDTSGETWSLDYVVGGTVYRSISFTTDPGISYIGIDKSAWTSGSFESIRLTVTPIPEASTTALLMLAAASLALVPAVRRRLRR